MKILTNILRSAFVLILLVACVLVGFDAISKAFGVPLDTWPNWVAAQPYISRQVNPSSLVARGIGTNSYYVLEVDPVTGKIPVEATFAASGDTNYGTVGANTSRTAAQIGNATGAADFGHGAVGAQTLRTVSVLSNGTTALSTGSGALSTATLRTVLATDQPAIPVTQSGAWNITNITGTVSLPTGAATETTLAAINTKKVQETLGSGAATAGILTTLSTRQEAVATPLAAQLSNGTSAIDYNSGAAAATTVRTVLATRHESAATPISVRISNGSSFSFNPPAGRAYADSVRNVYSSTNVTTGAWVQLIASTAAQINALTLFDSCGQTLELGTGAAASETRKLIIPPGGIDGQVDLNIVAGTRVSVRAISGTCSTGELNITGLN